MNEMTSWCDGALGQLLLTAKGPGLLASIGLLLMSLVCWYLVFVRLFGWLLRTRKRREFRQIFDSLTERAELVRRSAPLPDSQLRRLTIAAWFCWQQTARQGDMNATDSQQWLQVSIQQQLERERIKLESGLTVLACIGACAPFVGLLGTVWGIFHALQAMSMAGDNTLDKVAGPVGEALVMTGVGLMVALPAVLAYNSFVRFNRLELAQLHAFANELHALLVSGIPLLRRPSEKRANIAASMEGATV